MLLVMRKIEMVTPPSMLLLWMGAHLVMRKIEMVIKQMQTMLSPTSLNVCRICSWESQTENLLATFALAQLP